MKPQRSLFNSRKSVLAVRGALLALALAPAANAADKDAPDPAWAELTRAANSLELGIGNVDHRSAKFGEYNGLGKKGANGSGNLELHGGGAWDSNDATRWNLRGSNLGLETRDLSADYGVQGRFRLNFGYGELLHNLSDSYQTPFQGAGTGNLTLPSNWLKPTLAPPAGAVNFRSLSPAAGAATAAIRNADLPSFQNVDLKTKRTTYDMGFSVNLDPRWELTSSYRHENKNGTKAIGAISTKSTFESTLILPDPIDTSTDHLNLGLNYTGDKSFAQAAYHGASFSNRIQSLSWQDPSNLAMSSAMSSAPSNQFHQLNLTGGHNLSSSTKLVMNGSYGRNTQDRAFLSDPQLPLGTPQSSLNGVVVTKGLNLKLTARPVKGLNLASAYRFDDRDNRTPVNTYGFYDINVPRAAAASVFNSALGLPANTLGNNVNIYNNRPQSKRLHQFNLDGDYLVAKGQTLAAGYEFQKIDRHCNGTWIACVDANTAKENTLRAEWRTRLTEDLSGKVGYAHSRRTVDYTSNGFLALVPMANLVPSTAAAGVPSAYQYLLQNGLTGFGPYAGFVPAASQSAAAAFYTPNNNIAVAPTFYSLYGSRNNVSELPGMRRFNLADRDRDRFRSSVNWEVSEKLSLHGGLDFNQDDYRNSPLGLQRAKGWALNLDETYSISESFGVNLFYTYEDQRSKQASFAANTSNLAPPAANSVIPGGGCAQDLAQLNAQKKIDPCNAWSADTRDRTDTLGLTLRHRNLMRGKLDLSGSLIYSRARTDVGVRGGAYVADPRFPAASGSQIFIPATNLPSVGSNSLELRLSGQYALDKLSSVRMIYAFKRLKTTDFAYDGAQFGSLTTVMPSSEQSPQYTVHLIGFSYVRAF
jgi:MtrB/PioB family decaheme-associated outer membrane protein